MQKIKSNQKNISTVKLEEYVKKFDELKTVFDSLPDGVVAILDAELNVATANKAISEMLDLSSDSIIGCKLSDIFGERIPGLLDVVQQTVKTRSGVRNYTIESVDKRGVLNAFLISTAIIEEIHEPQPGIVLILHDVSEVTHLRKITLELQRYGEMIGKSEQMKNIYALIESIKDYDTSVLIYGETGTGKELVARAIHQASRRQNKPFVPVNCSALADNLIESELFGHVKGAFTGATTSRPGRFQIAHQGTLFLDEVGTLPEKTQVKLLRVVQEKVVEPLGSDKRIPVNVRILSATNRDLGELVERGEFREDLFYRLKVLQIELPPLRERAEDIPILTDYFITRLNRYYNKNIVGLAPSAKEFLTNYLWPGNVRELEHAIEHAFVLTSGPLIELKHLPPEIRHANGEGAPPAPTQESMSEIEENIRKALLAAKGNITQAAETLQMHRTTLWRKMKEFRIPKNFGKLDNR